MVQVLETGDLETYADAHDRPKWENPIVEEYNSLLKNKTWELVPCPQGKNVVK